MPRSPTLNLAASTAAQSLHANQPTDPLSSTATLTPRHVVIPPTRIPFHTPACLIRQHHQPHNGNAALLHPSGPQCSLTAYGSTLFPSTSRPFPPTFFHELSRSTPFLLPFATSSPVIFNSRFSSYSSLAVSSISILATNNHQIYLLPFILLSSLKLTPHCPYNPIRIYIFFASECPGCSHSLHASVHCFFQQSEMIESFLLLLSHLDVNLSIRHFVIRDNQLKWVRRSIESSECRPG